MAKGQKRSNREIKKPKSKKVSTETAKSATSALFSKGSSTGSASTVKR